jgi:hypothetical protein
LDDQVIDASIAIEALVGTDQEITYRLSNRVSGILASDDADRIELFKLMKMYYGIRCTLVHGSDLDKKQAKMTADNEPLKEIIRRLLVAFLRLSVDTSRFSSRRILDEQLDVILLSAVDTNDLRKAMGLYSEVG